jgi:hypothetical protein
LPFVEILTEYLAAKIAKPSQSWRRKRGAEEMATGFKSRYKNVRGTAWCWPQKPRARAPAPHSPRHILFVLACSVIQRYDSRLNEVLVAASSLWEGL